MGDATLWSSFVSQLKPRCGKGVARRKELQDDRHHRQKMIYPEYTANFVGRRCRCAQSNSSLGGELNTDSTTVRSGAGVSKGGVSRVAANRGGDKGRGVVPPPHTRSDGKLDSENIWKSPGFQPGAPQFTRIGIRNSNIANASIMQVGSIHWNYRFLSQNLSNSIKQLKRENRDSKRLSEGENRMRELR